MSAARIALNRFGLGASPDEPIPDNPKKWLMGQFAQFQPRPPALANVPSRRVIANQLADYLQNVQPMLRQARAAAPGPRGPEMAENSGQPGAMMAPASPYMAEGGDTGELDAKDPDPIKQARAFVRNQGRDNYVAAVGARATAALTTNAPFVERLVHFWANHFAISADKLTVIGLSGLLEFEAIRPHVLGRFGDMLNAVERHPAMLLFLDQAQSIGPNSMIGSRVAARGIRKVGINENLAREILELHTLGVRTGYGQADVTEFARALTGWTVAGINRGPLARFAGAVGEAGDFVFAAPVHEPGTRSILGKAYGQTGEAQAQAVLDDLAVHPSTADHIATKLCRHFAGDTPPAAMVARLKTVFLQTRGDLPSLYRALIDSPEAWADDGAKFRSPWDWSIASLRAVGQREVQPLQIAGMMRELGQPVWRPGSPAGYDDVAATWAGPDAVMRRVEIAQRIASRVTGRVDARLLAPKLFPAGVSPATQAALANAESPEQALALLLVSPESMRR